MPDHPQSPLFQPLRLADLRHLPGERSRKLYQRWAEGGAGLLITGNVMVAPDAVTGPAGVILDAFQPLEPFRDWAAAGRANGARLWMQINHPGRQVFARTTPETIAPSAVPMRMEGTSRLFAKARAMTLEEIDMVIRRFAKTAALAEQAGFDGVQIHAAHGYLLSQFLSPLTNLRTDE